jgi:hypothetical protein
MLLIVLFLASLLLSYVLPEKAAELVASIGAYCFVGALLASFAYVGARAVDRLRARKAARNG